MKTGFRGAFVISWSQTEIDGLTGVPISEIGIGSTWQWTGKATRIDAPRDVYVLENALEIEELHKRAAKNVRRMIGDVESIDRREFDDEDEDQLFDASFDVTDGYVRYRIVLITLEHSEHPMLLFAGDMPPKDQDLWVVDCSTDALAREKPDTEGRGVICFVPGTRIRTPHGLQLVEELVEGDMISTKDNGAQPIQWVGNRRISGARLFTMPQLRPIKLRSHILGQGEPDEDLLVSPDHRILVKGAAALDLFNTSEVLVTARDLVNGKSILVDHTVRSVTYVHLMMEQHQIVWANGVESESFHPAGSKVEKMDAVQRQRLIQHVPGVLEDPHQYGEFARRNLNAAEAAILSHGMSSYH